MGFSQASAQVMIISSSRNTMYQQRPALLLAIDNPFNPVGAHATDAQKGSSMPGQAAADQMSGFEQLIADLRIPAATFPPRRISSPMRLPRAASSPQWAPWFRRAVLLGRELLPQARVFIARGPVPVPDVADRSSEIRGDLPGTVIVRPRR
jgi:hypothetical protein